MFDSEVEQKILKAFRDFKEKKLDVLIIDGPAGSGKSTLVNWLLEKYGNEFDFQLFGTTNTASRVLSKKTGKRSETVHSTIFELDSVTTTEYQTNFKLRNK